MRRDDVITPPTTGSRPRSALRLLRRRLAMTERRRLALRRVLLVLLTRAIAARAEATHAAPCGYLTSLPLSVFDTATNLVSHSIEIPGATSLRGVALSPDGERAYVSNYEGGFLAVIETTTRTLIAKVQTPGSSIGVAISPDGRSVWVANFLPNGMVSVIDTETLDPSSIAVRRAYDLGVTPDGSRAYVTSTDSFVSVIDVATKAVTGEIPLPSTGSRAVAFTPDGAKAYVTLLDSDSVAVVDTRSNFVTGSIQVGDGPEGVAITPDGSTLYVANTRSGNISVIRTATDAVSSTIPVGSDVFTLALNLDGLLAYVPGSSGTRVISTTSEAVVETLPVTGGDLAVSIVPGGCDPPTATPVPSAAPTPKANGDDCTAETECLSGNCADAVCCDRDCDAPNEFCGLPGTEGTCVAVALPTATATPTPTLNQTPQATGAPCRDDTECTSGFCTTEVCCENRCRDAGETCAVPGFKGQCLRLEPTATTTPTITATSSASATPSVTPTPSATMNPTFAACVGNCNADPVVSVSELIQGVNIAIGSAPLSACQAFDANRDGMVVVNELVAAVSNLLFGCGVTPPTPLPMRTASPTATVTGTPTPTSPAPPTPTATRGSVCGGAITSVPKLCDLEIDPATVTRGDPVTLHLCVSDLEGDIDKYCVGVAATGLAPVGRCYPRTPERRTINSCVDSDPLPTDNLVAGTYVVALQYGDEAGHLTTLATSVFVVR